MSVTTASANETLAPPAKRLAWTPVWHALAYWIVWTVVATGLAVGLCALVSSPDALGTAARYAGRLLAGALGLLAVCYVWERVRLARLYAQLPDAFSDD